MRTVGKSAGGPKDSRRTIDKARADQPFMTALLDRDHPGHRAAVAEWSRLHQAAYPTSKPSKASAGARGVAATGVADRPSDVAVAASRQSADPAATAGPGFRHIRPYPGGPQGSIFTFRNDVEGGPSRDMPVRDELADAVEAAAMRLGFSVNVNSTIRTNSVPHSQGRAVDINMINGLRVDDPRNRESVERLQRELTRMPGVNQVLGPVLNVNVDAHGTTTPLTDPDTIGTHRNHLHVNVRR